MRDQSSMPYQLESMNNNIYESRTAKWGIMASPFGYRVKVNGYDTSRTTRVAFCQKIHLDLYRLLVGNDDSGEIVRMNRPTPESSLYADFTLRRYNKTSDLVILGE